MPVEARTYRYRSGRRPLGILTVLAAALAIAGAVMAFSDDDDLGATGLALVIVGAIMASTFLFSAWFSGRTEVRVDSSGVHSRVLFRVTSIPWPTVTDLTLRYFVMPGIAMRVVYYCVVSPTSVISFPNTLVGADELRRTIEGVTGRTWPEPVMQPTLR